MKFYRNFVILLLTFILLGITCVCALADGSDNAVLLVAADNTAASATQAESTPVPVDGAVSENKIYLSHSTASLEVTRLRESFTVRIS